MPKIESEFYLGKMKTLEAKINLEEVFSFFFFSA